MKLGHLPGSGAAEPTEPSIPLPPLALTVTVLAYNEQENLRRAVQDIIREVSTLDAPWELLLVDDGSTDATGSIADELAGEHDVIRVIHHETNKGLGGGYRTGLAEARGTYLIFNPADGQYPPSIITDFFPRMGQLDMLLGYVNAQHRGVLARAATIAERTLYRVLVGPMPRFQGVLMFRTDLVPKIELVSAGPGWGVIMEFIFRVARGPYRIGNRATPMLPRQEGVSKVMNARTIQANLAELLQIRRATRG